tara:strand:- start:338 stop:487 length:150 start_codon:yes stop_codon:yes gene_type:complete
MMTYERHITKKNLEGRTMDSIINEIANVGLTILFFLIAILVINWVGGNK